MTAGFTGCAGTDPTRLNSRADLNRDGNLSDAEYRTERDRILRATAEEKAKLRRLQAQRR
jgi:hypothetical protein